MLPQIIKEGTSEFLVRAIAEKLAEEARIALQTQETFSLALAGGSTPRALYQLLCERQWSIRFDWRRIHVFFGDERAVPSNHDDSNYRMAREAFLSRVPIPEENVHRMNGESENLEDAACDYNQQLREYSPLDLVLLGMGDDGHTASLFPGSPALNETEKLCIATPVASLKPHVRRLTITFPAINSARRVWLICTGESKAARLQQVRQALEGEERDVQSTPVLCVQPQGEYLWWLDNAAASLLS